MSSISGKAGESSAGKISQAILPWQAARDFVIHGGIMEETYRIKCDHGLIAVVHDGCASGVELKALANLIAAAPELLAALIDMVQANTDELTGEHYRRARAAISKAEGGQS